MTFERSRLSIEIGGQSIDSWFSYSLASDMLTPADQFSAMLAIKGSADERRALLEQIRAGISQVKAYIYQTDAPEALRVLQYTGLLDACKVHGDKQGGTALSIECRDRAAHLVQSSCDLTAIRNVGTNFLSLVQALVSPWSITVIADGTTSRDVASGLALSLPPNANRTTRSAWSQGLPGGADPALPTVFTDDEELLARERAAAAGRRRALASVRALGTSAISDGVASPTEQNAILRAQDRANALRSVAQRRAAESVASNGQSATAIRAIALSEARPQPGETVWNFILRHARRFGLVPWFSPDGMLIIASPNYGSAPTQRLVRRIQSDAADPNNILAGGPSSDFSGVYSSVTVYGRGLGRDATRAPIVGRVQDSTLPFPRPLVLSDLTIKDTEEAQRRAQREMMRAQHSVLSLEYLVDDHGNGRALYATDTIVDVCDEHTGVNGQFYVVSRTFQCDRQQGKTTMLKLCPKGAILL